MFSKNYFGNTIRVKDGLDPDQDQRSVGPDLGPNCLQRLSALSRRQKSPLAKKQLISKHVRIQRGDRGPDPLSWKNTKI